jgi:predicted acylesterase/phospholipase RssA
VDGALLRTVNASLVLERGADLVISVNPLVTFDSTAKGASRTRDLAGSGLVPVMSQTFRALIQSRMQVGMARYRALYPFADRLLFQPNRSDEAMFFANVFRYRDRARLAEHAYQRTRKVLRMHAHELNPIFERHGIRLRKERLADDRTFLTSTAEAHRAENEVIARLDRTLDQLALLVEQHSGA